MKPIVPMDTTEMIARRSVIARIMALVIRKPANVTVREVGKEIYAMNRVSRGITDKDVRRDVPRQNSVRIYI